MIGMDRKVQRVHKSRLDKAIESVGAQVNLLTAFAWDPLFTCKEGQKQSLYEEILYSTNKSPLISKCNFAKVSERNTTIEVLGYYLDTSGVHVSSCLLHQSTGFPCRILMSHDTIIAKCCLLTISVGIHRYKW